MEWWDPLFLSWLFRLATYPLSSPLLVMICLIFMMLIGILVMVEAIRETFD
jgi:hypothetical protein